MKKDDENPGFTTYYRPFGGKVPSVAAARIRINRNAYEKVSSDDAGVPTIAKDNYGSAVGIFLKTLPLSVNSAFGGALIGIMSDVIGTTILTSLPYTSNLFSDSLLNEVKHAAITGTMDGAATYVAEFLILTLILLQESSNKDPKFAKETFQGPKTAGQKAINWLAWFALLAACPLLSMGLAENHLQEYLSTLAAVTVGMVALAATLGILREIFTTACSACSGGLFSAKTPGKDSQNPSAKEADAPHYSSSSSN